MRQKTRWGWQSTPAKETCVRSKVAVASQARQQSPLYGGLVRACRKVSEWRRAAAGRRRAERLSRRCSRVSLCIYVQPKSGEREGRKSRKMQVRMAGRQVRVLLLDDVGVWVELRSETRWQRRGGGGGGSGGRAGGGRGWWWWCVSVCVCVCVVCVCM